MKTLIYALLIGLTMPIFAAEQTENNQNNKNGNNSAISTTNNDSTSDMFLKFILGKAEKYTEKGEKALDKTIDLAIQEAPVLAKEFITWRIIKHFVHGGLYIVFFIICFVIFFIFLKSCAKDDFESDNKIILMAIFGMISIFLFLGVLFVSIPEVLNGVKAWIAPRIYIFEELKGLIK